MVKKTTPRFFRTTLIGGAIFLIPIVFLSIILGKALQLTRQVAKPLGDQIPLDRVYGLALVDIMAAALILGTCFLAGLYARGPRVTRLSEIIDEKLLMMVPSYAFVKGFAGSMSDLDNVLTPVMVKLDDQALIGLEIERKVGGLVAVYMPGSPSPWSGSLAYMTEDRIEPLNLTVPETFKLLRVMGRGSGSVLSIPAWGCEPAPIEAETPKED